MVERMIALVSVAGGGCTGLVGGGPVANGSELAMFCSGSWLVRC